MIQDLPGEVWKDVVGFEDYYMISNKGRCKNKRLQRLLKPERIIDNCNPSYRLGIKNERITYRASDMMYEAFSNRRLEKRQHTSIVRGSCELKNISLNTSSHSFCRELVFDSLIENLSGEIWKDVKGMEDKYKISNKGRLITMDLFTIEGQIASRGRLVKGQIKKGTNNKCYAIKYKNHQTSLRAARLMYEAFIGEIPEGYYTGLKLNTECILENVYLYKQEDVRKVWDKNYIDYKIGDKYLEYKILGIERKVNENIKSPKSDQHKIEFTLECPECHKVFRTKRSADKTNIRCPLCKWVRIKAKPFHIHEIDDYIKDNIKIIQKNENGYYTVRCDICSRETKVHTSNFKAFKCTCQAQSKQTKEVLKRLGINSRHPLYKKWQCMIYRCYKVKENSIRYKEYKGRSTAYSGNGIKLCDLWLSSFEEFYKWSLGNGWYSEKLNNGWELLQLDRIDPDGDYAPYNCQWLTISENSKKAKKDRERKSNPITAKVMKKDYIRRQKKWIKEMERVSI